MANRKRNVVIGSAAAAGVAALVRRRRRRARLRTATMGFVEAVMPSIEDDVPPSTPAPIDDEAHAPGHRRVPLTAEVRRGHEPSVAHAPPPAPRRRGPGRRWRS